MPPRLASVSVDLDSLPHYCRIHGLPEDGLDDAARTLIYRVAVPRFLELFAEAGVPATLFAIGEDLAAPEARAALSAAHAAGIEIGNHSASHDYALTQRTPARIDVELADGEAAITAAVGARPVGFRAPGYTLSPALYQALCARGYAYDSSTFPAAPYYAAKAAIRGVLALVGRPSRSVLDSPRVLLAPRAPYSPDPLQPYQRGDGAVLELPVTTAPFTRVPFIGTFAAALPGPLVRATYRTLRGDPFFNFELHAIDLLDASDGIPPALIARQADLRVSATTKRARLREVLRWAAGDYQAVTLAVAARAYVGNH